MSPQETPPTILPEQRIHSMTTPVEVVSANGGTLLRFAVVLCTTFALHIAMTPPNPPPSDKELLDVSRLERMSMRVLTPFFRYIFILPGFIEIIAIAMQFLTLPEYDLASGTCAQHISLNPVVLIACVLGVLGMGIRFWCYRALGRLFTFQGRCVGAMGGGVIRHHGREVRTRGSNLTHCIWGGMGGMEPEGKLWAGPAAFL
ncbi:hypothetical protein HYDPIDRAFT_120225, partial [Hydnomerulius pinastri MD-312]